MLISIGIVGSSLLAPTITRVAITEPPIEITQPTYSELDKTIEWLSWCESRNNPNAVNKHDPDTASYGLHQYKWNTWNAYLDKSGLFPDAEPAERWNLIWDGYAQETLTRWILENETNGWMNWYNCLKGKIIKSKLKQG